MIPCRICDNSVDHFGDCCADCQAEIDANPAFATDAALDVARDIWEIGGPTSFEDSEVGKALIALAKEFAELPGRGSGGAQ